MKKIIFIWLIFSLHIQIFTQDNYQQAEVIQEGFVTFATKSYFPLLKILLDSVHIFSTRPIVAFGINDDIPFSQQEYPRLIRRRLDVDLTKTSIFYQKPRIILESTIEHGIYVEADDIVFDGIDNLFEECKKINQLPLCPLHPQDPKNQQQLMRKLNVKQQSMPYVHGHILFASSCKNFIKEWYETCLQFPAGVACWDEGILNVLLWKYQATEYLPVFDPYFDAITAYQENRFPTEHGYKKEHPINYYMFHGCKDPVQAQQILTKLVAIAKKNN